MTKSKFSKKQIAGALLLSSTAIGATASGTASANSFTNFLKNGLWKTGEVVKSGVNKVVFSSKISNKLDGHENILGTATWGVVCLLAYGIYRAIKKVVHYYKHSRLFNAYYDAKQAAICKLKELNNYSSLLNQNHTTDIQKSENLIETLEAYSNIILDKGKINIDEPKIDVKKYKENAKKFLEALDKDNPYNGIDCLSDCPNYMKAIENNIPLSNKFMMETFTLFKSSYEDFIQKRNKVIELTQIKQKSANSFTNFLKNGLWKTGEVVKSGFNKIGDKVANYYRHRHFIAFRNSKSKVLEKIKELIKDLLTYEDSKNINSKNINNKNINNAIKTAQKLYSKLECKDNELAYDVSSNIKSINEDIFYARIRLSEDTKEKLKELYQSYEDFIQKRDKVIELRQI